MKMCNVWLSMRGMWYEHIPQHDMDSMLIDWKQGNMLDQVWPVKVRVHMSVIHCAPEDSSQQKYDCISMCTDMAQHLARAKEHPSQFELSHLFNTTGLDQQGTKLVGDS